MGLMLTLMLLSICLGSVSAADELNDTTVAISDNSQIDEIKTIDNVNEIEEDVLSSSDEDVIGAITPTVTIEDKAHPEEINNISKGTTVSIDVQSYANYNYHYDYKVAHFIVNGETIKSTNLLPYNNNDNDRRGSFDYTFTQDGTYEVKVMTDPYYGGGDNYLAGTSNIITYIVGNAGNATPATDENSTPVEDNSSTPSTEASATISLYDMTYPSNTTISHTGDFDADLCYNLEKSGEGFSDEIIYLYCNGQNIGNNNVNSQGRLGKITVNEDDSYEFYIIYQATVNGKDIEARSNTLTYVVKDTTSGETNTTTDPVNDTEVNETIENTTVSTDFVIRDAINPADDVIEVSVNDTYIPNIQYRIDEPEGFYAMPTIDVYVNEVHPTGAGIYNENQIYYGKFSSLGNCFNFTENGTYVVKLVFKTQGLLDIVGIEKTSNSITYKVLIINETNNETNATEDIEDNTTNTTEPETKKVSPQVSSSVKNDGSKTVITVNVPSDATGSVVVKVNGKNYPAVISKGSAIVEISDLDSGDYSYDVIYPGDDKYEDASVSGKFTIKETVTPVTNETNETEPVEPQPIVKKDTKFVIKASLTRVATDYWAGERGAYFYATLQDIDGNPLANKNVEIVVNGVIYKVVSNKNGKAGVRINLNAANTHTYALNFKGDDYYNAAPLASSKLIITKKKTTISAKNKAFKAKTKTKTIKVTLKTIKNKYNGKTYLKAGKKLTLKVNGKTYSAKINKKGVATFKIKLTKKGKFTAKIKFAGDKTYKASTKSIKITIK